MTSQRFFDDIGRFIATGLSINTACRMIRDTAANRADQWSESLTGRCGSIRSRDDSIIVAAHTAHPPSGVVSVFRFFISTVIPVLLGTLSVTGWAAAVSRET